MAVLFPRTFRQLCKPPRRVLVGRGVRLDFRSLGESLVRRYNHGVRKQADHEIGGVTRTFSAALSYRKDAENAEIDAPRRHCERKRSNPGLHSPPPNQVAAFLSNSVDPPAVPEKALPKAKYPSDVGGRRSCGAVSLGETSGALRLGGSLALPKACPLPPATIYDMLVVIRLGVSGNSSRSNGQGEYNTHRFRDVRRGGVRHGG